MEYTTRKQSNILIFTPLEDLTFHQNESFGNLLHQLVHDNNSDVIVDLSHVNLLDGTVAGHFVAAKRECDLKRRHFGVANVSEPVGNVLHSGGTDHQVRVYRSTEEAIADLADRSHGSRKRRLVMNIKCGHDDCVYFTYGKQPGFVVPACEYPFQDDITNGPTCKCYKPDWQQLQENVSLSTPSPFRNKKKRSLYEVRNKAAEEFTEEDSSDEFMPEEEIPESSSFAEGPTLEDVEQGAARVQDPNLKPKIAVAVNRTEPTSLMTTTTLSPETNTAPMDDPFSESNFPSAVETDAPTHADEVTPPPVEETVESETQTHILPTPSPAPVFDAPTPVVKKESSQSVTPEVVVKQYVEAWNQGDFEKEYQLLSSRNRAFSEVDYVRRRQSLRSIQMEKFNGRTTHQEVARVDSSAIDGIHATVEITRVDRTPLGSKCYGQYFHLILEEGFWKIQRSEDGETRNNPIKPKKGRVMKAGDFLGKSRKT